MLVKSTGPPPARPAFPAARSAVRGPVDRAGAERLQAVVDGEQLDRVARPHEAALDHPDADPAPAGGQRPGHARLGERIDVATGRAGAVVGEGRLADAERPPGQRPQVDAPGGDVAAVLPVLHGDPGGLRDGVEVLAGDERDLALVDVGPVAPPGGVAVAVEAPAGHGLHLVDRPHRLPAAGHEHPLHRSHRGPSFPVRSRCRLGGVGAVTGGHDAGVMSEIAVEILPDGPALAARAADLVAERLAKAAAARGRATLAVSGGSTPAAFLAALAERAVPWEAVHVFQVDERVAPAGHPDRNLTGLRTPLL